jgi:hypothetical protein
MTLGSPVEAGHQVQHAERVAGVPDVPGRRPAGQRAREDLPGRAAGRHQLAGQRRVDGQQRVQVGLTDRALHLGVERGRPRVERAWRLR